MYATALSWILHLWNLSNNLFACINQKEGLRWSHHLTPIDLTTNSNLVRSEDVKEFMTQAFNNYTNSCLLICRHKSVFLKRIQLFPSDVEMFSKLKIKCLSTRTSILTCPSLRDVVRGNIMGEYKYISEANQNFYS
ncbi:hypothetical protein LXL04_009074 [Taraxacum kok-saghyz]